MQSVLRTVALGAALALFTACGGGGDATPTAPTPPSPPAPVPVASVLVTLGSAQLIVGGSTVATAETRSSTGASLSGRAVAWSSSNPSVATITSTGSLTALAAGTTTITATSEGQSGSATLTVLPVPVGSVTVAIAQPSLTEGATTIATATVRSNAGDVLTGRTVTWSTSNAAVATVSGAGAITAVAPGTAMITAVSEGQSGAMSVTVTPAPVASITVSLASASIAAGDVTTASATLRSASGQLLTARTITWSSSNPAVATVNASGSISAITPGSTTITASSDGQSGSATLTVTPPPVATVTVTLAQATLSAGSTTTANVALRDASNQLLTGRVVTWTSSNAAVASISAAGVVSALTPGTSTITATSEGRSGSATLTVLAVPVATVTVTGPASLVVGQSGTFVATLRDADNQQLTGRAVSWSTSNPAVASVSASGVVTALSAGFVSISATSEGRTGSNTITVISSIASVTLNGETRVKVGDQYTYTATVRLADGTIVSPPIIWSLAQPTRGTMSEVGVFTPTQPGPITVQATIAGQVWTITVNAYDWERLSISGNVYYYLPANNTITNKWGVSEYAELTFVCSAAGNFFAWVSTRNFVTANGNVAVSFDGATPVSQVWSESSDFSTLFKPGLNATVKSFALQVAASRIFGFAFTEFQAGAKAMLFRVTGLSPRLTELFALCPSGSPVVQGSAVANAAYLLEDARGVVAAFETDAQRRNDERAARRASGTADVDAPVQALTRVPRASANRSAAERR